MEMMQCQISLLICYCIYFTEIKKKGKLTRAERNRIRRRKIAEHEALMAAQKKKIIKGIDTARQLAKALDKKVSGKK